MLDIDGHSDHLTNSEQLSFLFAPLFGIKKAALAVSGGADSMALMHLAARFQAQPDSDITFTVLTMDHGLRAESAQEVEFVAQAAKALGLECHILRGENFHPVTRIQESARALRYRTMAAKMQALDLSQLLTAHHIDDQTETFMMRLARGSGVAGLGAMSRTTVCFGMTIFRPLLDLTKTELLDFLVYEKIDFVDDPSNQDQKFERVRWRNALTALAGTGLDAKQISLSTKRLRRADVALRKIAENAYEEKFFIDPFGCVLFDRKVLLAEPAEIGIRLLARALDDAGGLTPSPDLAQVEALYDVLIMGDLNLRGQTLGGCGIRKQNELMQVFREVGRMQVADQEVKPGDVLNWDERFQIIIAQDAPEGIVVRPATDLTRAQFNKLVPDLAFVPMEAIYAAPLVVLGDEILALGEHILDPNVDVFRTFGPNSLS